MECGIIDKKDLGKLITSASEQNTAFFAPAEGENGVEIRAISRHKEIVFDYDNVKLSPKSIFFPQREVLCRFSGDTIEEVKIEAEGSIVFGIRPCDASALVYLDKIFKSPTARPARME